MKDLNEIRLEINDIDKEMASLFEKRMNAVRQIGEYKMAHGLPIFDGARENAVIERNSAYITNEDYKPFYVTFLQNTMGVSRQFQNRLFTGVKVAYSGVEGAFAHIAAGRIFPESKLVSYKGFEKAYRAVVDGECDLAVLPIENSFEGEVVQVTDLMYRGSLYVNGVYDLPVVHNLLAVPGARAKDIKKVISHPQALGQCANYIKEHGYEEVQASNTAVAAKTVADNKDKSVAAIASKETAELYGLSILEQSINDSNTNTTRFAVFSKVMDEDKRGRDDNIILIFTVNNEAGALANAINIIGKYGFNMKVLRSRPIKDADWEYYFYVELEGNECSDEGRQMLGELRDYCHDLKIVGHYSGEKKI